MFADDTSIFCSHKDANHLVSIVNKELAKIVIWLKVNKLSLNLTKTNCWFSHDVTKMQTKKLSILPRFYFHYALEQPETNFHTDFRFKRVLGFVIKYA